MSSQKKVKLGPIELEVIHGTIRAAELEIEAAVERTARSPMIRDQHDYRVALFDAKGRKLTGRSYSAITPAAPSAMCPTSARPCRSSTKTV